MTPLEERLLALDWLNAKKNAEHHELFSGDGSEPHWREYHAGWAATYRARMAEIEAKLSMKEAA